MRAVVLNEQRQHELVELPDPEPGEGEVLVRPHYCGICGTDLHARELEIFRTGVVQGHEFAGEVVAVGAGVSGWSVGQRVTANPNANVCHSCRYCSDGRYNLCKVGTWDNPLGVARHGGMAELVALHASHLVELPESLDTRRGAWAEPLTVAVRAVRSSPMRVGDAVAVVGGGPVGQLVLQVARRAGASRVVMVEPSPYRRAMAQKLGADEMLTPQEAGERLASGDLQEVEHAWECSGHPSGLGTAIGLVAAGGSIRLVGMPPSTVPLEATAVIFKELQILGGFIYVDEFPLAVQLLATGGVDVDTLTTSTTPLDGFEEAFAGLRRPESSMKVLISTGAAAA